MFIEIIHVKATSRLLLYVITNAMLNLSLTVPAPVCVQEGGSGKYTSFSESVSVNVHVQLLNKASKYLAAERCLFTDTSNNWKCKSTETNGANLMVLYCCWYYWH
jgi:hypothetical protein